MKSTDIPVQLCPSGCGYKMEAATEAYGNHAPAPGDLSVCFGCNSIHLFDVNMMLRLPTPEEKRKYSLDPRIMKAQFVRQQPFMPPLRKPRL